MARILTNWGLGHDVGGYPLNGYAANDYATFRSDWPLPVSTRLAKLGCDPFRDFLPGGWEPANTTGSRYAFAAASGATSVPTSRGESVTCPSWNAVYDTLAISPNTTQPFYYDLTTAADFAGYWAYNDETKLWYGFDAGIRAELWRRRGELSSNYVGSYTQSDYDTDKLAYDCAVEGLAHVFDNWHSTFPLSKMGIHIWPIRAQNTTAISFLRDLNIGQPTGGAGSRWGDDNEYRLFWLDCVETMLQPAANVQRWLAPRLYMDDRLRNWTGGVDIYGANGDDIRASWYLMWQDICELAVKLADGKPVHPAVMVIHPGRDNVFEDDPSKQGWYKALDTDMESFRLQIAAITASGADGPSFWCPDDTYARTMCNAGVAPTVAAAATDAKVVYRKRMQRRFPGLLDGLDPFPQTEAGELAWRSSAVWSAFNDAAIRSLEAKATAAAFGNAATQTTLASIRDGISTPSSGGGGPVIGGG